MFKQNGMTKGVLVGLLLCMALPVAAVSFHQLVLGNLTVKGRSFSVGANVDVPQSVAVASDGTGAAATFTLTPTSSTVYVTCSDPQGCAGTLSETGADSGQELKVVNVSTTYAVTFADSNGVQELTSTATLGVGELIHFSYNGSAWLEDGRIQTADGIGAAELADTLDLDADLTVTAGGGEQLKLNKAATDATADNGMEINYTALDTTSGTAAQYALYLNNAASTEGADALEVLDNADSDDAVGTGILILNPTRFTSHMNTTGAMVMGTATVTSWTFATDSTGDGEMVLPGSSIGAAEIVNITRSVPLPLGSWLDCTSRVTLSVDDGADAQPDFTVTSSVPRIVYDVTGGSPDTNEICTTFVVPADYASGGSFNARIKQSAATVTQAETFSCRISVDDAAIGAANAATLTNSTSVQTGTSTPAGTWAAGALIAVACKQGNASADDAISILAIEGSYVATE